MHFRTLDLPVADKVAPAVRSLGFAGPCLGSAGFCFGAVGMKIV